MKVALFPGHTGKDSGAVDGFENDALYTIEAAITYPIASKVALFLNLLYIDHTIAIGSFSDRIRDTQDCTLGISIHADVSSNGTRRGYHVIHYPRSVQGKRLAVAIDQSLAINQPQARKIHSRRDLAILRRTRFPVVLIECGFLSNVFDEAQLQIESHQYNLAWGIVEGIRQWTG